METQELSDVIQNLLDSHEELLAGVGHIVCDIALLNTCRIDGEKAIKHLATSNTDSDLRLLEALHAGGVDNWDGYEAAQETVE